jgi:hypothetical protein
MVQQLEVDSKTVEALYNLFVALCREEKGICAENLLASMAGHLGYCVLRNVLEPSEVVAVPAGAYISIPEVSRDLRVVHNALLRTAAAFGFDPDPNAGWIGIPSDSDYVRSTVQYFNQHHYDDIQQFFERHAIPQDIRNDLQLFVCCYTLKQVAKQVISEEEGKQILMWGIQCGAKTMPSS